MVDDAHDDADWCTMIMVVEEPLSKRRIQTTEDTAAAASSLSSFLPRVQGVRVLRLLKGSREQE
jgi:hypothetical protein